MDIPDPNKFVNSQSTIIQYADGQEIGRIGSENRKILKLAAIPLTVRHAVLAAENRNFYSEAAISPTGIARAIFNNIRGGSLQGGSTITQQYAKTAFLTQDRNIIRKVKVKQMQLTRVVITNHERCELIVFNESEYPVAVFGIPQPPAINVRSF